jgi:hypothetical protein
MARTSAAHRAPHAARNPVPALAWLGKATAATTAALLLAVAGTSGTYALLSANRPIPLVPATGETSATIAAGTANLIITGGTVTFPDLYPGEVRNTAVVVSTTGTVPLQLGVSSISGTAPTMFTASIADGPCASNSPAVTSGPLTSTVTAATSATLCVRLGLASAAPASAAGTTSTIVINLLGSQV